LPPRTDFGGALSAGPVADPRSCVSPWPGATPLNMCFKQYVYKYLFSISGVRMDSINGGRRGSGRRRPGAGVTDAAGRRGMGWGRKLPPPPPPPSLLFSETGIFLRSVTIHDVTSTNPCSRIAPRFNKTSIVSFGAWLVTSPGSMYGTESL